MDTSALTLFNALGEKMNYLTQRQRVLAQNIANANTPRYIPSDLKPFTFEETIDRHHLMMKTSNVKHMDGTLGSPRPFTSPEQRRIYESSPDGNGVVIEEQVIKANQTQMDFTLMTRVYEKNISMMRYALRGTGAG
ncbi:MAG: flagellar basal body rod protein FlgB [Alphaproteobacteria bacterium]|nr:flagellar basal body rod protein FlgB [Alphaproteobacteria bacterium]MAS49106.1 flagellar basal body rod protein FlgB [Alphaproteobacteria bacterium]MAX97292.1 flagellar basal body rod protein FlgB [Alphaproteobacteria bacterium]MBN52506.1 flagellar basal body rod protein FlgB [Alphaproteobacteria bacterium]OUT39708.1 MAG: flagellar basal-body rod protein FlgB [Micavibrio sp. TMED2]|tara:strand:+ start:2468 stop:2875 length:408 start_codon:yes stop_codon:yes gene_type:complete